MKTRPIVSPHFGNTPSKNFFIRTQERYLAKSFPSASPKAIEDLATEGRKIAKNLFLSSVIGGLIGSIAGKLLASIHPLIKTASGKTKGHVEAFIGGLSGATISMMIYMPKAFKEMTAFWKQNKEQFVKPKESETN